MGWSRVEDSFHSVYQYKLLVVQEVLLIAALRCSVVGRDFPALEVVGLETLGYLDLATIQLLESIVMTGLENTVGAAFL